MEMNGRLVIVDHPSMAMVTNLPSKEVTKLPHSVSNTSVRIRPPITCRPTKEIIRISFPYRNPLFTWNLCCGLKKVHQFLEFWVFDDAKRAVGGENEAPDLGFKFGHLGKA
jgi:hypothetical protein